MTPEIFYAVSQSIITIPDNSVLLSANTTEIAIPVAQHEASHQFRAAASTPKNTILLEKIEKIDTPPQHRINTLLTQLKVRAGSHPLRIIDI